MHELSIVVNSFEILEEKTKESLAIKVFVVG